MMITRLTKKQDGRSPLIFVSVTHDEALQLIQSLVTQIHNRNPNTGRMESVSEEGVEFSIAVLTDSEYDYSMLNKAKKKRKKGGK